MRNTLFKVFRGDGNKAEAFIKSLGVLLGVDYDSVTVKSFFYTGNGISHKAGAVTYAMSNRQNSSDLDRSVIGRIGAKISLYLSVFGQEAVKRVVVDPVEILTDYPLFKQKYLRPCPKDLIKLMC